MNRLSDKKKYTKQQSLLIITTGEIYSVVDKLGWYWLLNRLASNWH